MTQFTLHAEGLDRLMQAFQKAPAETTAIANDALRQIGRAFVPAKGTGPLAAATPRDTGDLAKSTFFTITGAGANQELKILQTARTPSKYGGHFYGSFVRFGTPPHTIRPRYAKVLHWVDRTSGEDRFSMRVEHPGTKPNPYHRRVLRQLNGSISSAARRMGERLAEIIAFG